MEFIFCGCFVIIYIKEVGFKSVSNETAQRIVNVLNGGQAMLKSEKRESQKFKKRYGPRRHKLLGINKWTRKRKEMQESKATEKETEK